jgi:hypothetical protein
MDTISHQLLLSFVLGALSTATYFMVAQHFREPTYVNIDRFTMQRITACFDRGGKYGLRTGKCMVEPKKEVGI